MDAEFWHQRWALGEIGFHQAEGNPLLARHVKRLKLEKEQRVLVPLCGKSRDILWLLSEGYRVVGVELSRLAVDELFEAMAIQPQITEQGKLLRYSADGLDIFVGDFFELTSEILGPVDAVYDRAAMVALPPQMRHRYAERLWQLCQGAPVLLITYEYDQSLFAGPPFAVLAKELEQHYGRHYRMSQVDVIDELLKGKVPADEVLWHLVPGSTL